mgnify:CR=1 FL=1
MMSFDYMHQWKDNIDKFFGESFWGEFDSVLKPLIPQINIYKQEYEALVVINVPGIKKMDQINCSVRGQTLNVNGIITIDTPGFELQQEEIIQGSFDRSIELPFIVRKDKIQARYEHGLVWIYLYKDVEKEKQSKQIDIKEGEN